MCTLFGQHLIGLDRFPLLAVCNRISVSVLLCAHGTLQLLNLYLQSAERPARCEGLQLSFVGTFRKSRGDIISRTLEGFAFHMQLFQRSEINFPT